MAHTINVEIMHTFVSHSVRYPHRKIVAHFKKVVATRSGCRMFLGHQVPFPYP
jgi:hypothetical protein